MIRNIIDDYLDDQTKYSSKYGANTIVLYEVGSFFEIYAVPMKPGEKTYAHRISELLNIICTRKNKNNPVSRSNPFMAGFPTMYLSKNIDILIKDYDFTVVLVEQVTKPPNPKREVTKILSPGTYISENANTAELSASTILSIYIESVKCFHDPSKKLDFGIVGWTLIDTSTGQTTVQQLNTPKSLQVTDDNYTKDELQRVVTGYSPREIIVSSYDELPDNAMAFLGSTINVSGWYVGDKMNQEYKKIAYQNQLFEKLFVNKINPCVSPIEHLNMEFMPGSVISYVSLVQYIYEHDPKLMNQIQEPSIWEDSQHLVLENNCIEQLDIINKKANRYGSLFNMINFTSTVNGKRLLNSRLLSPSVDLETLQTRYDTTYNLNNANGSIEKLDVLLQKGAADSQRLHRKMAIGSLHPIEFNKLNDSYNLSFEIRDYLKKEKKLKDKINDLVPDEKIMESLQNMIDEYTSIYDMKELNKYFLSDIRTLIWKHGVHTDLDDIENDRKTSIEYLQNSASKFNDILCTALGGKLVTAVKLEDTDKEGYYLSVTKKRAEVLKKHIDKLLTEDEAKTIKYTAVSSSSSTFKITWSKFKTASNTVIASREKIKILSKKHFVDEMAEFHRKYFDTLNYISSWIAKVDVAKSYAKCSAQYKYCKPTLIDYETTKHQVCEAKDLRHAIIERIQESEIYVPNDVTLDSSTNGLIVYGCNAVGKSSLLKSLGIAIILAQIGMNVPCSSFKFTPYKNLFTRIKGSDDLFRGKSSFVVEMSELKSILNRADAQSLVIGDEVCRGTEHTSGLSLVATTVNNLDKRKTSFMLATHHHQLPLYVDSDTIKHVHLQITLENEKLVYNRKLKDGPGTAIYGLEVAKYVLNDDEFLAEAHALRKKILGQSELFLSDKQSRYNAHKYIDVCEKCGKLAVDTHHLLYQKNADESGFIGHVNKNHLANLQALCEDCHKLTHKND